MCSGRWPRLLLGVDVAGGLGNNDNNSSKLPVAVDTSGVLAGGPSPLSARARITRARWRMAAPTAGGTTSTVNWVTAPSWMPWCRSQLTPPGCSPARTSPHSASGTSTRVRWRMAVDTAGAETPGPVGQQQHHQLQRASAGEYLGGAGRQDHQRDQRGRQTYMCGGRRPGILLGQQRQRKTGQQQHRPLQGAGCR